MIQEVAPSLYRVQIPLPNSPLKYLNSYFILGGERNLIVDTGLNRDECLEAMQQGIQELGVDLERTDFFITHMHADHFALTSRVISPSSRIFFNRPEAELIEAGFHWEPMIAYGGLNGFPRHELEAALQAHPGFKHGSEWVPHLSLIQDGQPLSVGDYNFICRITPGHTLGHTCLWEAERGILIAGDHILGDITPNIQCWRDGFDPLAMYLDSLDQTATLDIRLALPGHRGLIPDCAARIAQLKEHHHDRLREIGEILAAAPLDAYQTAARMSWDIKCDSWQEFPVAQKWFATGEAMAHLRYLENKGELRVDEESGRRVYHPAS
ncbi:MAG: MBL fold metallo-hydrolase [Desulfarculaceae bacterium]|nr:MBL fold metallo-hydrolase [Desulfarculaceae bacterium]MCF8071143.1 MBL fold metallo-hydrolase [Desulfarculaceae bacterium]MCF8101254.1 MBL fold metallo-hydrolase [Desulfarculaceae bacterium]MCF8115197.1 MBL fold metallo-hydrolase [Desulfarculaceae bacterium]